MSKITVDSAALETVAENIESHCNSLGFLDDLDDIDDAVCYGKQILFEVEGIRRIIAKGKPEQKAALAAELRELSRGIEDEVYCIENDVELTPLRRIAARLAEIAGKLEPGEGVKE